MAKSSNFVKMENEESFNNPVIIKSVNGGNIIGTDGAEAKTESEGVSKRAQKKLLKRKEWLDTRPERRVKEKAKKKAKIEKLRLEKGKKTKSGNFLVTNPRTVILNKHLHLYIPLQVFLKHLALIANA